MRSFATSTASFLVSFERRLTCFPAVGTFLPSTAGTIFCSMSSIPDVDPVPSFPPPPSLSRTFPFVRGFDAARVVRERPLQLPPIVLRPARFAPHHAQRTLPSQPPSGCVCDRGCVCIGRPSRPPLLVPGCVCIRGCEGTEGGGSEAPTPQQGRIFSDPEGTGGMDETGSSRCLGGKV